MAAAASKAIIRLGFCLLTMLLACSAQLSPDFYERSCPKALSIIRNVVRNAVYMEHRMGASLLRLHFHDCFVIGCDASVLLDDTPNFTGEKTAGPNANSLRGFEVIDKIKSQLENICPGVVSCADIVAAAAQDSVAILGGPSWEVELGRRDSTNASYNGASTDLPSPLMDLNDLISSFSKKGFTAKEMVALSGAHTIGKARCLLFRDRIYNESNIDPTFALMLKATCPSSGSDNNNSSLDSTSPDRFDNAYFRNLIENKGVLHSDQQLFNGSSTDSQVRSYASNFGRFYVDFANAMVKMGSLNTLTGSAGQIRTNCRKVN